MTQYCTHHGRALGRGHVITQTTMSLALEKTTRPLSPGPIDVSQSFAQKKARLENEVYTTIRLQINPYLNRSALSQLGNHSPMITALDIKNALSEIDRLQSIGNCPTIVQDYRAYYRYEEEEVEDEDEDEDWEINNVRIFRRQKLSSSKLQHSCRRQLRSFRVSSVVSRFLHRRDLSARRSISELLVKAVNLTARSAHVATLF